MDDCLSHRSSSMEVTHYRKDGAPLRNFVRFFPLTPVSIRESSPVDPVASFTRPTATTQPPP